MIEKSKESLPDSKRSESSSASVASSAVPRLPSGTPASARRASSRAITSVPPPMRHTSERARPAAASRPFSAAMASSSVTRSESWTRARTRSENAWLGEQASSRAVTGTGDPKTMRHAGTPSLESVSASRRTTSASEAAPSSATSSTPSCVNWRGWPRRLGSSRTTGAL